MTSVPQMTYKDPQLPDTLLEPAAWAVLGDGGIHRAASPPLAQRRTLSLRYPPGEIGFKRENKAKVSSRTNKGRHHGKNSFFWGSS